MDEMYFHFTIGPVQGFVAQARRTRDFWAGSFLLSWLAGVAMNAVLKQCSGNKTGIVFPRPSKELLDWWKGRKSDGPRQGTIPNRFLARVDGEAFNPQTVVDSVILAWRGLAAAVWDADLEGKPGICSEQRVIWNRQINGFWEISWALTKTKSQGDARALDQRKNWRTRYPTPEPGVSCMVIDGFQELSGESKPGANVTNFWEQQRKRLPTDLREGECLCAIAFVKRRFVRCFHGLKIDMPGNWTLTGWRGLTTNVPSNTFMAATPWLARVVRAAADEPARSAEGKQLSDFYGTAKALADHGERATKIKRIEEAVGEAQRAYPAHKEEIARLVQLDGSVFFDNLLDNGRLFQKHTEEHAAIVREKLKKLKEIAGGGPVPFYAVLAMDGDSLGAKMSKEENQEGIASALNEFTQAVAEKLVTEHHGFLIYAGGDDVLAVFAAEDALAGAVAIREEYRRCFKKQAEPEVRKSTISAAVHYVDIQRPLTRVLGETHDLLEKVAKDQTGRDSLAVRLTRPGGVSFEWSMPWEIALTPEKDDQGRPVERCLEVERLAGTLRPDMHPASDGGRDNEEGGRFSHGFFYKIRNHIALLNGGNGAVLGEKEAKAILATDYLNSGVHAPGRSLTFDDAVAAIGPLFQQCRRITRDPVSGEIATLAKDELGEVTDDAAMLVRFLATTVYGGE